MRKRNWSDDLVAWAGEMRGQPFSWGTTDCGSLVRAASVVMYRHDLFKLRPWKGPRGMKSAIEKAGGVEAVLSKVAHTVGLRFASTGDIVVVPDACPVTGLDSVFVVVGSYLLTARVDEPLELRRFHRLGDVTVWRLECR